MHDIATREWLARVESATRYPSIPYYHVMDDRGRYTDAVNTPLGEGLDDLVATEKVDGTNARIILHPDGDWQIGSRIEILAAKGDRVYRTTEGIVNYLLDYVDHVAAAITAEADGRHVTVVYCEVYGLGIGRAWKNYTAKQERGGARVFDIARINVKALDYDRELVSRMRDKGTLQDFCGTAELNRLVDRLPFDQVPQITLPTLPPEGWSATEEWLLDLLPSTGVALDGTAEGKAEGLVIRTKDRSTITKFRIREYTATRRRYQEDRQRATGKQATTTLQRI